MLSSRTGWTEEYIRWHLPLSRGMAYFHAARMLDGQGMQWPEESAKVDDWLGGIRENLRQGV